MGRDRKIESAVAAGEANKRTAELVRNWCRHVRIEKFGGVGLIEVQTGLPIGHHSLQCDHASAGGMASWRMSDAAIDFHDRNCVGCPHRVPVGIPNLGQLVAKRDHERERRQAAQDAQLAQQALDLKESAKERDALRGEVDTLGRAVLDSIGALQDNSDEHAVSGIVESARMAPEVFTPPLVEYCFVLLERRRTWFYEAGLQALDALNVDSKRLVRCALRCLGEHRAIDSAVRILITRSADIDWDLVPAALPVLAYQAYPSRVPFLGGEVHPEPGAVLAVFDSSPQKAFACLQALAERGLYGLERASRCTIALCEAGRRIPNGIARVMAARLGRLDRILDEEDSDGDIDEIEHLIRKALAAVFEQEPEATDTTIQGFLEGAREPGQVRLYSVYRTVMSLDRWTLDRQVGAAHALALKRLIRAATQAVDHDVVAELCHAFDHPTEELYGLLRDQSEGLLGAALILDDRRNTLLEKGKVEHHDPLVEMERENKRSQIGFLIGRLVANAALASAGDLEAVNRYLSVLQGIPETRNHIKAVLLREATAMAETTVGLALILPFLYSSMVGRSVHMRAAAAEFVENLDWRRRADLPDLVLEALVMQLTDPFVLVHQCALDAIERLKLPESLGGKARSAILNLLFVYSQNEQVDSKRFLLKCISSVLRSLESDQRVNNDFGAFLIAQLKRIEPYQLTREVRFLSKRLGHHDDFASLLVQLIVHAERETQQDQVFDALNMLDASMLRAHHLEFSKAANSGEGGSYLHFVEAFTRAGLWEEAVAVTGRALERIPDTRWMRARKISAAMNDAAVRFETAIATGDEDLIRTVAQQWRGIANAKAEVAREANEKSNYPFPNLFDED
jgi:hypothetical protein